jgi:hypothetical protein
VYALALALLAALFATACTVLESETPGQLNQAGRSFGGVYYALPRGIVDISLVADEPAGIFTIKVSEPTFIPDGKHRYFLRYRPHPSYEDEITVTMVKDGRPLLKSISATTTDKTKDIIVNLAKAAAALPGLQSGGAEVRVLGQVSIDPTDPREMASARDHLAAQLDRYVRQRDAECRRFKPADDVGKAACSRFAGLLRLARQERLLDLAAASPPPVQFGRAADCSIGICYRSKEPFIITFTIAGVTDTRIVELPNASEPVAIDIRRAFLVQKIQELEFDDDGFLLRAKIDKKSELLAAAQLPLAVATAVSQGLQLRIDVTQNRTASAEAEAKLIKERAKLRQSEEELRAKQAKLQSGRAAGDGTAQSWVVTPFKTKVQPQQGAGAGSPKPGEPGVDPDLEQQSKGKRP